MESENTHTVEIEDMTAEVRITWNYTDNLEDMMECLPPTAECVEIEVTDFKEWSKCGNYIVRTEPTEAQRKKLEEHVLELEPY